MPSLIVRSFRGKRWYSIRETVNGRQKTVEWLGASPTPTQLKDAIRRYGINIQKIARASEAAVNGEIE